MANTKKAKARKNRLVDRLLLKIDSTAIVKWENRAAAAGKSLTRYLSLFLTNEVQRT